jgi:hypothetical protein
MCSFGSLIGRSRTLTSVVIVPALGECATTGDEAGAVRTLPVGCNLQGLGRLLDICESSRVLLHVASQSVFQCAFLAQDAPIRRDPVARSHTGEVQQSWAGWMSPRPRPGVSMKSSQVALHN